MVGSIGQALTIRGDRLVLGALVDSQAVGIYGAAATFAESIWLIPMGAGQLIFRYAAQGRWRLARRLQVITLACMVGIGAIGALLARPAVALLLGPGYSQAVPLIWMLIAAALPMGAYHVTAPMLNGAGDLKGPAIAGSGSAVLLFVLCFATIPILGAAGAAIASFFAYSLMAGVVLWRRRRLPDRRPL